MVKMRMFFFICTVTQLILTLGETYADALEPCHKSDPNFTKCFLRFMEKSLPSIAAKGVREYGIPPMEPFNLPYAVVDRTINDVSFLRGEMRNVTIRGLTHFDVKNLKIDLDNLADDFEFFHPHVFITMDYKAEGKLLNIPFTSEAGFSGNFTDIKHNVKISFKTVKRNGVTYFSIDKFKFKGKIGDFNIKFTSKSPEEQPLDDFLANTFNLNSKTILELITPLYIDTAKSVIRPMFEQVLAQIPAERILPE